MISECYLKSDIPKDTARSHRLGDLPIGSHFVLQELRTDFRVVRQLPSHETTIAAAQEGMMTQVVDDGGSFEFESSPGAEFEFDPNLRISDEAIVDLPFDDEFFFLLRQFVYQHASEVHSEIEKAIEDYLA